MWQLYAVWAASILVLLCTVPTVKPRNLCTQGQGRQHVRIQQQQVEMVQAQLLASNVGNVAAVCSLGCLYTGAALYSYHCQAQEPVQVETMGSTGQESANNNSSDGGGH
jgi:hypothetical protein